MDLLKQQERKEKSRSTDFLFYLLTCIIILTILSIAFLTRNIWPFGKESLLVWDMKIQYINIYNWFYDVLHGQANVFYDFSKSLGGNMYGIFSTYLCSPVNLLVYFFPPTKIPYFITLSTVIKILLSSVFCQLYIRKRFNCLPKLWPVIFGVSYGLIEYNIGLASNLHFLDIVYMLPLLAISVYYFVKDDNKVFLCLMIALTVIFNWYIGFAACLYIGVYFFFELLIQTDHMTLSYFLKKTGMFLLIAILGVMISAITFLPGILATMTGKAGVSIKYLKQGFHCDFLEPLKALSLRSRSNISYTEPSVFCGSLSVAVMLVGLFDRNIDLKKRLLCASLLFIFLLSFSFVPLEVVLSGMKKTYSFHFRYSFVFSFSIILSAALFINEYQEHSCMPEKVPVIISASLCILYALYGKIRGFLSLKQYLWLLIPFLINLICIIRCISEKKERKIFLTILLLIFFAEEYLNAINEYIIYTTPIQSYSGYIQEINPQLDSVLSADDSVFFRAEKTFSQMNNSNNRRVAAEGLTFNYNPLTHYSSLIDNPVVGFMENTGYQMKNSTFNDYVSSNPVIDSFVGIKYLFSNDQSAALKLIKTFSYSGDNEVFVYENEYALPLCFEVDFADTAIQWSHDPFENQMSIMRSAYADTQDLWIGQTLSSYHDTEWTYEINSDGPVYVYLYGEHDECDLYVNEKKIQIYYGRYHQNVSYVGNYQKGDRIVLKLDEENCNKKHEPYVYSLNLNEYERIFTSLKESSHVPTTVKDGYVVVDCNIKDDDTNVLFTIPYGKGWKLRVDGKEYKMSQAYDVFITMNLDQGEHHIELTYKTPHFRTGVFVTCVGLVLLFVLDKKTKKKTPEQ